MTNLDVFRSRLGDWAQALEILSFESEKTYGHQETVDIEEGTCALAIAVLKQDTVYLPDQLSLIVTDPSGRRTIEGEEDEDRFAVFYRGYLTALVVRNPVVGPWTLEVDTGGSAFALNLTAFKSRAAVPGGPGGPGPTLRCRACKMTTKGLAMAIIAAVTAGAIAAIPHALIAAVAAYLGIGAAAAAAFISSVLGDTADQIAEKLCKAVRLC